MSIEDEISGSHSFYAALPSLVGRRIAVVTIDLHRGHLDPAVATMPLSVTAAAQVTRSNISLLRSARARQLPVIHVMTSYHAVEEISSNPWWKNIAGTDATRANVLRHQLPGSPGLEIMPGVIDHDYDVLVSSKKRYDSFMATELDHVLRSRNIDTLLLTGVNTNSCVLATAIAANARDYSVIVLEDCVDTMDRTLHEPALNIIQKAFGWVATSKEIMAAL
ncbi:cysteine hydrolase family protein [Cryobacterium sp. Y50]|uniref:cysteine hydrolase family protein n=1 Tax=Cryobacterium sp. Y50 TaxID=2048286 RepID=UPI0018ECDEE9|nr:isochorismatase family cysteine hydrolase [Cryobacterium sp. Y50]